MDEVHEWTFAGRALKQKPIGRTGHYAGFIDGELRVEGGGLEINRRRLEKLAAETPRPGADG